MPSSHLILRLPLLLLPSIPPSIRVFLNKSALRMRWPKYWSFSLNISPSSEHPGLISFRMDRFSWLLSNVLFLSQDPIHGTTSHSVVLSSQASLGSDYFFRLPCFWMTWIIVCLFFICTVLNDSHVWLWWVSVAVCGRSLLVASGGFLLLVRAAHCSGFSCCGARTLGVGSVVVVLGLSCSAASGTLPDQGLKLCPLDWQTEPAEKSWPG